MTIAIRVDDLAPGGLPRRARLYEILGFYGIHPYKIKQNRSMYFIVMEDSKIEQALDEKCKESLRQENFIIQTPLEYNALKTIVAKQLDQIIDFYEDEDIIQNIESKNEWCKVESIYKLQTPSKIIKIRFKTTEMAQRALQDGLYILNQKIPSRNIEKEVFIKLKPCYNCFSYNHITKNCPEEKMILCSNCASRTHRQSECDNESQKCINCNGDHRTLAAACPIRKKLIKEKSKQIRDRARSRSRSKPSSYSAAATNEHQPKTNRTHTVRDQTVNTTKEITATILTAIVASHYVETLKRGSFQNTLDKIFEANGLPRVVIPIDEIINDVSDTMNDLIREAREKQTVRGG